MSGCNEIRDELKAYLDRELADSERPRVSDHLNACPDCRREMETMMRIGEKLTAVDQAVPRPELRARILAQLPDAPPSPAPRREAWWSPWRPALVTVGSLAVIGLIAGLLWPRQPAAVPPIAASKPAAAPQQVAIVAEGLRNQDASNQPRADRRIPGGGTSPSESLAVPPPHKTAAAVAPPAVNRAVSIPAPSKPETRSRSTHAVPPSAKPGALASNLSAAPRERVAFDHPAPQERIAGRPTVAQQSDTRSQAKDETVGRGMDHYGDSPKSSNAPSVAPRTGRPANGSLGGAFGGFGRASGPAGSQGPQGPQGLPGPAAPGLATSVAEPSNRAFSYKASQQPLVLTVGDVEAERTRITEAAKQAGGYVERVEGPGQADGEKAITLLLQLPKDRADSFLQSLDARGLPQLGLAYRDAEKQGNYFGLQRQSEELAKNSARGRNNALQDEVRAKSDSVLKESVDNANVARTQRSAENTNRRVAAGAGVRDKAGESRKPLLRLRQETENHGKAKTATPEHHNMLSAGARKEEVDAVTGKRALGAPLLLKNAADMTQVTIQLREVSRPAASAAPKRTDKK